MRPIQNIVIVGGGTSGWIAAAILASQLSQDLYSIHLVESGELGTIGIGESTVPPFLGLLRRLGIDELEFVRETQATYKLGIQFSGWRRTHEDYFHPFGVLGHPIEGQDFYQCWLKSQNSGEPWPLQLFSPSSVMAQHGRFFYPEQARNTPVGGANYALHVDASRVGSYLRRYAENRNVYRTEGRVTQVCQMESGFIKAIILESGQEISGDFFIDCTGFRGLLIGETLKSEFIDWSNYLPCDRAIAIKTPADSTVPPFTVAKAQKAGWTWKIPLQTLIGNGYVYASRFCSDAQARATLLDSINKEQASEPRFIPFKTGHRQDIWKHNCLSLGLASGFVEPLESTSIHLITRGMEFFLRHLPDSHCHPALIREYNRRMTADYEEVRDFIMLHYCMTQRTDTPFWRWCQHMELPDSLRERIELFQAHGGIREGIDNLFRASSWQSVFEGLGIRPQRHSPRVDSLDAAEISEALVRARQAIAGMVKNLPTHEAFLQREMSTAHTWTH